MPEALAVLLILVVSVFIYAVAWIQSRNPARGNVRDEADRLRLQEAWLRERLQLAQRERWDADMIANLADEHRQTARQLASLAGSDRGR